MKKSDLQNALDGCLEMAVAELTHHVTNWEEHVHSEMLRKYAGMLDGIRFCKALLHDQHLLNTRKIGDVREALRVIGIAKTTAAFTDPGFHEGVGRVQTAIVKILERELTPA